jgi:hypothetical protein
MRYPLYFRRFRRAASAPFNRSPEIVTIAGARTMSHRHERAQADTDKSASLGTKERAPLGSKIAHDGRTEPLLHRKKALFTQYIITG